MSCRRAARTAARQIGGQLGIHGRSFLGRQLGEQLGVHGRFAAPMAARQIGGQLGCSCQSIFSEGRARGGHSSPGRAGVYEWTTHSDEFSGRRGRGRRELIGWHRRRRRPVPSSVKFRILLHVIMQLRLGNTPAPVGGGSRVAPYVALGATAPPRAGPYLS